MPKIDRDHALTWGQRLLPGYRRTAVAGGLLALALALALASLLSGAEVPATITVAQVLAACERGYAAGNRGVDAAMCEWYANPCGCKPGAAGTGGEHWCIPAAEPAETTIRKVVTELRRQPDPAAPVERVVPDILARMYPCQPTAGESSFRSP